MDKKIIYTLGLKFKKYNLNFKYEEDNQVLTIVGKEKIWQKAIFYSIVVFFFTLVLLGNLGIRNGWFNIYGVVFCLFIIGLSILRIVGLFKIWSVNNKFKKLFFKNSIELVSKKESQKYTKENIKDLTYEIESLNRTHKGSLFILLKNDSTVKLLTLTSKNQEILKLDIDYLTGVLKNVLKLKNNNLKSIRK